IRGETSHYDYVCQESARALMELSLQGLSIGYGILTCENKEQALIRASSDGLNKGKAATLACLRMINIKKEVLE
ncbi:MAG: 6,7-dimethyl-8-ribityllumazine synthase, partial [Polaribacter sp.]|nr:6,7-dimethyl-8-ribityllumazine synthase [Polaribacter sp.]